MKRTILPVFQTFPEEEAIIGHMVIAYGEIEFCLAVCLGAILNGDLAQAIRVLFRMRGETNRIDVADALLAPSFQRENMGAKWAEALGAVRFCLKIRNQYAHSHFYPLDGILYFAAMEDGAKSAQGGVTIQAVPITLDTLKSQEEYFGYAGHWLRHLAQAYEQIVGLSPNPPIAKPKIIPRPLLDNRPPKQDARPETGHDVALPALGGEPAE